MCKTIIAAFAALLLGSCIRQDYSECPSPAEVAIPVRIDWSQSNIPVTEEDPTGGSLVHRVSLRFYPMDDAEPFERYLEGNIFEDTVLVPPGEYRVIVMNESVTDVNYWEDAITFSDADDYVRFSATVNPMTDGYRKATFPYYRPVDGEQIIVDPYHLASWSLDELVVPATTLAGRAGVDALTQIVMRRLTYNVKITASMTNLSSAAVIQGGLRGFAQKVYMATGEVTQEPSSQLFALGNRVWDTNQRDGQASAQFLTFGRVPEEAADSYHASLDVLLTNGSIFEEPVLYNVSDQVAASSGSDITLRLPANDGERIELPEVEGGIAVLPWDDEEEITLH